MQTGSRRVMCELVSASETSNVCAGDSDRLVQVLIGWCKGTVGHRVFTDFGVAGGVHDACRTCRASI